MAIDDETFFAWLDGELDAAEADEVEAAVAADPRLARMAEQHRRLGARLKDAFGTVVDAPIPERVEAAVRTVGGAVVDLGSRRRAPTGRSWSRLPQWAAMAASLAVGILVGGTFIGGQEASPIEVRGGKIYAAAQLDDALEQRLASADEAGSVRIGLTFRDQAGAVCRSFTGEESSGLACRDGSDWQVRGLFAAPEGQAGDYRMAAGTDPNLAALIDSTIDGEAFNAEQEKAARDRGWE